MSKKAEKKAKKRRKPTLTVDDLRLEADIELQNNVFGESVIENLKKINFNHLDNLSPDVILVAAVWKFGLNVLNSMCSVVRSVTVLPIECQRDVLKMIFPATSPDDSAVLLKCAVAVTNLQCDLHVPTSTAFQVFAPPVSRCFKCNSCLVSHNKPVRVNFFGLNGHSSNAVKVSLKCNRCDTLYGYSKFGDTSSGFRLYDEERPAIEASDVCLVDRSLLKWQISLA